MIRLHHVALSRSFRVLWLLSEMGIEPEIVTYSITDGSLRAPDYLAKSPAGRVPALEVEGLTLFESGAITEYLCETHPEHGLGRAPGHPERARYLEWLHFAETQAHLIANLNLQWVFLRDPSMRSPTLLKMEAKRLAITLGAVERTLAGQDHLLTSGFSAADTMLGYNLLAAPHFVRMDPFPAIRAYLDRIAARPGWQRARARDGAQKFYAQDFYEVTDG
ncbi:glutathione S-transferase family protein [Frigidibacter sp. RF13]|uniref:glutathione S-transferase family protein n=1 Tax=Frigidibacter sp. RF13 TaxID=2997340 RepID=UPI00226EE403|nr:glutathione S-transferase family protein [Frigidibacter sp. RF13]MCY1125945.1 glutathione S-transferase family protein [Frigidibacter sp. RF13]